jgi:hypothetical protein
VLHDVMEDWSEVLGSHDEELLTTLRISEWPG